MNTQTLKQTIYFSEELNKYLLEIGPIFSPLSDHKDSFLYVVINDNVDNFINGLYNIDDTVTILDYLVNNEYYTLNEDLFVSQDIATYFDMGSYMNMDTLTVARERVDYTTLYNIFNNQKYNIEDPSKLLSEFANIILTYVDPNLDYSISKNNLIYSTVLDYLKNGKYNTVLESLGLILGAPTTSYDTSMISTSSDCNCGGAVTYTSLLNSNGTTVNNNQSCYDIYRLALNQLFIDMLSSLPFYDEWFFIDGMPNDAMIDKLIELLESFKEINNHSYFDNDCNCGHKSLGSNTYYVENSIIDNYIEVLNYIKECKLYENKNKISVYGKVFAENTINL